MSTKPLRFRSEVHEEINEAFDYYFKINPSLSAALLIEVEESLHLIASHPQLYPLYTRKTRRRILNVFPYSIVFLIKAEVILIVALAHAKQRPSYWRKRL